MDTLLHGKIGYILGEQLISKDNFNISKNYFVYGNLLPDLSLKYRFSMHTIKDSFSDTLNIIKEIIYNKSLSKAEVSIKLGLITHYLCDFFTFPHNEGFDKSIFHHEFYEQTQRMKFWYKIKSICNRYDEETNVNLKSVSDLIIYIKDMHSIYLNNKSNKERDILFSIILIRVVCTSILKIREQISKSIIIEEDTVVINKLKDVAS